MNTQVIAVYQLSLGRFSNAELAAFNNAIQWLGHLPEGNLAFEHAKSVNIVNDAGQPDALEELRTASANEVMRRVDAGTFV